MLRISCCLLAVACVAVLGGCQTIPLHPEVEQGAVTLPGPGEVVAQDNLYILVDASGSMRPHRGFEAAKELAQAFVGAAPDGRYRARILSYGGEWQHEWTSYGPEPLNRARLAGAADKLRWLKGSTPLATALDIIRPETDRHPGNSAIVIITDGVTDSVAASAAINRMKGGHPGWLCVYPVQVGESEIGKWVLDGLAQLTGCGSVHSASDLASAAGMEQFVREVFFGPIRDNSRDSDGDGVPDSSDECPNTPKGAMVDARGCWTMRGVFFDTDKSAIRPDASPLLDNAAQVLRENPDLFVSINGHTDTRGSDAHNKALSERRANAVFNALIERGINRLRLHPEGMGELRPVVANDNATNRQLNRRVELNVID